MKKILIFSLAYYPQHVSGAEAAVKEITDRTRDIQFFMITLRFNRDLPVRERIGNIEVCRVGSGSYVGKMLFPLTAAFAARRLNKVEHFDALWALMTYMLLPTMIAKILGIRAPHILTLQDGDPYEKVFGRARIKLFVPLIDSGFRSARVIQVISHYLGTWPAKRGSRAPVVRVPNGANPNDVDGTVDAAVKERIGAVCNKKPGDIYLINTARLEEQKAADVTIRALALLPPHISLVLVGGGSQEQSLKDLANTLGVATRTRFVGQVSRPEAAAWRTIGDIFVGPSRSEGLGNAFLSAMAGGLPVVATQVGGLADFIFDAKRNPDKPATAWAVDPDNPEQIADAVTYILAHPDETSATVARARQMVLEQYTWDAVAKRMQTEVFSTV